jgi:hypothetical protein
LSVAGQAILNPARCNERPYGFVPAECTLDENGFDNPVLKMSTQSLHQSADDQLSTVINDLRRRHIALGVEGRSCRRASAAKVCQDSFSLQLPENVALSRRQIRAKRAASASLRPAMPGIG